MSKHIFDSIMDASAPKRQSCLLKRVLSFLRRQTREVTEGGLPVLLRKSRSSLLMLLAVSVVLVVRALRPLVVIRFGPLVSSRIGHFAAEPEVYLCERDAGMRGWRIFDIFYYSWSVCNQQLKRMWERTLHISSFAWWLDRVNRWLPGCENHVIPWRPNQASDIHGLLARTQAHLSFTPEEERLGRAALRELGISEAAPFVCFHARNSAYLDKMFPNINWRYHDYRDSTIHNYVPAMEELVHRGYFAIRTGAIVKEMLNSTSPMIIDYATNGSRTDFLDIFLCAKCRFFIGDTAGISNVSRIFRRPIVYVNWVLLEYASIQSPNDLFIPKKLWLREERRFLTFREILESEVGRFDRTEQYRKLGIEVVENTSEEITALAIEMDERLKGTWKTTEEDEELQRRFWSLFKSSELNGVFLSHIGAKFLRQNRELLD